MKLFDNNNIIPFILASLPALVYSLLIYRISKSKSITVKSCFTYFMLGILSTCCVDIFHFIFPQWTFQTLPDVVPALWVFAIVQIGMIEEIMKFACFKLGNIFRTEQDSPVALMYYSMSVACGFAVAENILYLKTFGNIVLLPRAFSSVIVHMICGILIGYFVAAGRMNAFKRLSRIPDKLRMPLMTCVGIAAASLFHGVYDFIAFYGGDHMHAKMIYTVIAGIFFALSAVDDLKRRVTSAV